MKILMICAELFPFAKTGGLADSVCALSKSLALCGIDIRIVIPRYYNIDKNNLNLLYKNIFIGAGFRNIQASVYSAFLPDTKIPVYFIDHEECFGREGIYGSAFEPDYKDNPFRFTILSCAAFKICRLLNWFPNIMHTHDWPAAAASVLLKHYIMHGNVEKTASVFTIHNMGYQGEYPQEAFVITGLGRELKNTMEFGGKLNFLKAALVCADAVTAVSPSYADEISTYEGSKGLYPIVKMRINDLFGILNGADTFEWNPKTDKMIPENYSKENLNGKKICKRELQKYFSLPENADIPIIGFISRLAEQKGIAEIFAPLYGCAYKMCTELNIQFIILGSGENWCEQEIKVLQSKLPNFRSYIGFNEQLSHLIEAGADFFLMPSRYEPCGLNQIYSQIYGTLPIVRATGGLIDTVENYSPLYKTGSGFLFNKISPQEIFDTVKEAVNIFVNNKDIYKTMQQNAMSKDFSWDIPAKKYIEVYKYALSKVQYI